MSKGPFVSHILFITQMLISQIMVKQMLVSFFFSFFQQSDFPVLQWIQSHQIIFLPFNLNLSRV